MRRPNYDYAKRQKEIAKKQKKEEKLQRKAAPAQDAEGDPEATSAETGTAPPATDD